MPFDQPLYPVNLSLAGRRCLVVGGGPVALQKARELVVCGASVEVVAPEILDEIASLDGVICHKRPYVAGEVTLADEFQHSRIQCALPVQTLGGRAFGQEPGSCFGKDLDQYGVLGSELRTIATPEPC